MKKSKVILIMFLLFLIIFGSISAFIMSQLSLNQYNDKTAITIPDGVGAKEVFNILENNGVIKNADIAYYYARIKGNASFKAGNFEIPHNLSLDDLIKYLSDHNNIILDTIRITLYEDDNLSIMANRLSDNLNINYDEIMQYWDDVDVVKTYISKYEFLSNDILNQEIKHPLEGFLFPNTYEFLIDASIEDITIKLLEQTNIIYQKYKNDFNKNALSIHEIFTLASIIQYESSDQMELVSSVFYNRLNNNIPLQSTVTACYGKDLNKEECHLVGDLYITTKDNNPYNTYENNGLPPGPILCPGEQALNAALNPANSDYYFFIGAQCGDIIGTTVFAKTYEEHNQNIKEYITSCK